MFSPAKKETICLLRITTAGGWNILKMLRIQELEFWLWLSGLMIWLVFVVLLIQFPGWCSGLRTMHCQSYNMTDLIPCPGTSICHGCSQKRKKERKKEKKRVQAFIIILTKKQKNLPKSFYEATISLIPKPDKDTIKKKKITANLWWIKMQKSSTKY